MNITSIYEPIQEELLRVEENLRGIDKVDSPQMAELLEYTLKSAGKGIRPAITLLAGRFYHYNLELLLPMATAVEFLHIATLIHDDTIDNSPMRRGKPTINSIWGGNAAVLLGDYLLASSAELVSSTQNVRVIRLFAQTLKLISGGQLSQSFSAYDLNQVQQHYYHWIGSKTASLFSTAAESGTLLSLAPEEVVEPLKAYGYNLGMAFQIIDDILDFIGEEEQMGKPVGSDLLQGTLTLPSLLLIERYPKDNPIKGIFENRGNQRDIKLAVEMVCNSPIIEECYNVARSFCSQACHSLKKLADNATRRALVDLADYVIERKK